MKQLKLSFLLMLGFVLMGVLVACQDSNDVEEAGAGDAEETQEETTDETSESDPEGYLEIRGSDTMVNLGQSLAEHYMDTNPNADLSVTGGGSGTGIAAMINNEIDVAQSSRAMTEEEIEDAENNGAQPLEFIIGQDGLAVATNNDNPIEGLTVDEIKSIFVGDITDWSELGWDDGGEITVYSRQSNSGTYVYFNENIMDGEDFADGAMFMPGSSAIREAVEQEANAIGYIGIGYIDGINALNVAIDEDHDYVTPFEESNVDEGIYPIARPLYFYVNGEPDGLMFDYLKWVLQDEDADDVRHDTGFYQIGNDYQDQNVNTFDYLGIEW
ncbi:phosphate ABC transporter substrate-binding protein, PhoT family [Pelagirhabdus alkalitolerans]|uniref:Phosphate-binding protein n=1 Tax=Pelagirhabdus alkalitolerans TaxID=1612202 RepID=A0A1G6HRF6_9BACI|nr:phosphate ABC transporter substrate-binding protein [Pelagirhabdus alkalitolerans]SDB96810.1 phosphate ABC transporter substrate-binding protein, PhoT family [Pelagirhabdus alkalitolerans]